MTFADLMADPLRVIQDEEDALVIENRPIRRAVLAVAAILLGCAMGLAAITAGAVGTGLLVLVAVIAVGGMILFEIVHMTKLSLDRRTGQVTWRVTNLGGKAEGSLPLSVLSQAELTTRYGATRGTDRASLSLVQMDRRETTIPLGRPDAEDVARMAAIINAWLSRTRTGESA